jgi:hypothetical protein
MTRLGLRSRVRTVKSRAVVWFFGAIVAIGMGRAEAQTLFTIKGQVREQGVVDRANFLNLANARVWVMKGRNSKELSGVFGDGNEEGYYEIPSMEEGDYDLVACEVSLRYQPKRLQVHVPHGGNDYHFLLYPFEPSNGYDWEFKKTTVTYLKHIETGCEPPPIKTEGPHRLHFSLEQGTFEDQYAYCRETDDDKRGSYKTCIQNQTQKGRRESDVEAAIGQPEHIERFFRGTKQVNIYPKEHLKITFLQDPNDKVMRISTVDPIK